jgi:hypothetical protein
VNGKLEHDGLYLHATSNGAWNEAALAKAIKDAPEADYLVYGEGNGVFAAAGVQRASGDKVVFDPYKGEYADKESAAVVKKLVADLAELQLTTFQLCKVEIREVSAPITWDWHFNQMDPQQGGDAPPLRELATDPSVNQGICFGMSYNWCKRILKNDRPKREHYEKPEPYKAMAAEYKKYAEGKSTHYYDLAKSEGLEFEDIPKDGAFNFKNSWRDIIPSVNDLEPGAYIWVIRTKWHGNSGHAMALKVDKKAKTGKFFDPNLGQFTIAEGQQKLGEFLARGVGRFYQQGGYDLKGQDGKWFFLGVHVKNAQTLRASPEVP